MVAAAQGSLFHFVLKYIYFTCKVWAVAVEIGKMPALPRYIIKLFKQRKKRVFSHYWHALACRAVIVDFVISRLLIVLVTFLSASRIPQTTHSPTQFTPPYDCVHNLGMCLLSWKHWDVNHYLVIAQYGYDPARRTVFFPLWPLLIGGIGRLFGGTNLAFYAVSVVLCNLFFYCALVLLYRLIRETFTDVLAKKAIFFLCFAPYSLFFAVGYSESLFLLLTAALFYLLLHRRWWLAGVCGFLAALTRPTGLTLVVPFVVLLVQQFGVRGLFTTADLRLKTKIVGALLLVPLGLLVYMAYLQLAFGDPLSFAHWEHRAWFRDTSWPWLGIILSIQALFHPSYPFEQNFNNLLFVLLPLIALVVGWRRLPLHYSLFSLALIVFSLCNPYNLADPFSTLASMPRYVMMAFPAFIVYAYWAQKPLPEKILTVLFIAYLTYNVILFAAISWVA